MSKIMTIEEFEKIQREYKEAESKVLIQRHSDYGPYNIARCPAGPLVGINVRMWDKLSRASYIIENSLEPKSESLFDSYLDLANYGTIASMVLDKIWPGIQ